MPIIKKLLNSRSVLATIMPLILLLLAPPALQVYGAPGYARQAGFTNIQASHPITGGATDRTSSCIENAAYNNHHSESWIGVDPSNPSHLVAMSKFFFDPEYYLFHLGSYVSTDAGQHWADQIVPGFDCQTAPSNTWTDTTDPVLAFDSQGNVYSAMLPFSFRYNPSGGQVYGIVPNDAIYVVKSTDGGQTWNLANQGKALAIYNSSGLGLTADKQWIAVDTSSQSPFKDNIYVAWSVFAGLSIEIWLSHSSDHGQHFTTPVQISRPNNDGPVNTYVFPATGPDGTLYVAYTSFPSNTFPVADVWLQRSTDGGLTFTPPLLAATFTSAVAFPNTTFREGITDNFAVNPSNGHLLLALEVDSGNGADVQLTESTDRGTHWSTPVNVNDPSTVHDGTDQFQPTVVSSPNGIVAVSFYDRRLPCPTNDPNILSQDAGRTNFCINTTIQFYNDANGLQTLGSNLRVTTNTWDPQNPGTTTGQLPRPGGPKGSDTFIGDYFGLALSSKTAYVLFASNYNTGQNPANDQQQFLGIVPIPKS